MPPLFKIPDPSLTIMRLVCEDQITRFTEFFFLLIILFLSLAIYYRSKDHGSLGVYIYLELLCDNVDHLSLANVVINHAHVYSLKSRLLYVSKRVIYLQSYVVSVSRVLFLHTKFG